MRILRVSGIVEAPRDRLFTLLEDPRMAGRIHPPFLEVGVRRSPWLPKPGERTELEVVHRGVRFTFVTELAEYRRGSFLLERQVEGPFRSFEHAVSLDDDADGGSTRLTEVLAYQLGFGVLGAVFDRLAVRRDLDAVLRHRLRSLQEIFRREE